MRAFKQINTSIQDLSFVQDNIANAIGPLAKIALLDGIQIDGLQVTTAPTKFNHLLNRKILGWFIVDKTSLGDIASPTSTATTITLVGSAPNTISIWIY